VALERFIFRRVVLKGALIVVALPLKFESAQLGVRVQQRSKTGVEVSKR
jgi:hypothetical protein